MKKFQFTIRGNKYDVELLNLEDNIAQVDVNGTTYEVEIHQEVKTTKTPKLVRQPAVPTGESDKAKTSKPSDRKGVGLIKAPLPGTILQIKVKIGDAVKVGSELLIMEAMKMENSIKADKEGKIINISVKPGDTVLEGDPLIEIGS